MTLHQIVTWQLLLLNVLLRRFSLGLLQTTFQMKVTSAGPERMRTHTHTHTPYLLLGLDGVHWSHIITGNVSTATGGERASVPPIPFTEREREGGRELGEGGEETLFYISWHASWTQNTAKKTCVWILSMWKIYKGSSESSTKALQLDQLSVGTSNQSAV